VLHVFLDHIAQLRAPLNTSRSSTNNSKVQQHLLHLLARSRQRSHLKATQQSIANLPRVANIFEEICMLSHTFRVKSLRIASHSYNQFIPANIKHLPLLNFLLHIAYPPLAR
jgi:hypothetical protein